MMLIHVAATARMALVYSLLVMFSYSFSFAMAQDNVLNPAQKQQQQQQCTPELAQTCQPCIDENNNSTNDDAKIYNCSLPGLATLTPGMYEGVIANYLSFATQTSCPNLPVRASEFQACTGGSIVFSEASNVWVDPISDLGTKTAAGIELYDAYFMSYSHFPEASSLDLAEHLNDRIRASNDRLQWQDVLPQVRRMGEYRRNGETNIDFLMYDGDFFVPVIRLDLLEKHDKALPNTWNEVVDLAKYFNGTDLNDDGDTDDFGFCHFPQVNAGAGSGHWDWWWTEAVYSTWATYDQTEGVDQGFFFNQSTMEPRIGGESFQRAADIWKDLWEHATDGCNGIFASGRCAIGFAPPGCWKGIFLHADEGGVARRDENGTVLWRPTFKNGEYAEPYRFKPFGSTEVFDRDSGTFKACTKELCPKAEVIPLHGHMGSTGGNDRTANVTAPSPLAGQLINRAPFYWSGGLGTLIRKSSPTIKKDLLWDFFVYTNSAATSVNDVANYASWLDSWRYSQLLPGDNFLAGGWSQQAYAEHANVMLWALSDESNGALNLRIPGLQDYTHKTVGKYMSQYIRGQLSLQDLSTNVEADWIDITTARGKLDQLEIYRAALNLDSLSEFELCTLHRMEMDQADPSICRKFDEQNNNGVVITAIVVPTLLVIICLGIILFLVRKKKSVDAAWSIKPSELQFDDPPEVLGRGTFGLVLLAEYRGTQVAVKRVIPPKEATMEQHGGSTSGPPVMPVVTASTDPLKSGERVALFDSDTPHRGGGILTDKSVDNTKPTKHVTLDAFFDAQVVEEQPGGNEQRRRPRRRYSYTGMTDPVKEDVEEVTLPTSTSGGARRRFSYTGHNTNPEADDHAPTRRFSDSGGGGTGPDYHIETAQLQQESDVENPPARHTEGGRGHSSLASAGSLDSVSKFAVNPLASTGVMPNKRAFFGGATSSHKRRQHHWILRKLRLVGDGGHSALKADFVNEMRQLSKLRHPCIVSVMGAVTAKGKEPMLVLEFMDMGSLYDLLHNETFPLDGENLLPILRDIAQGVRFLHAASPQVIHGDLKAQNILVDSRFRAKVADFGLSQKKKMGATGTPFWMAPELLRGSSENSSMSDVYSFGMILWEVYARKDPYEGEDVMEVLEKIADPKIQKRPTVPTATPSNVSTLMVDCFNTDPDLRPSFQEIDIRLRRLNNISVAPTNSHRNQSEGLLYEIFPPHVADALKEGRKVEPEKKEVVTIFFCDVVGFTTISSQILPEKVSDMLDRLYHKFDDLTLRYDVFKVETVGDAYMCVTNLVKDQPDDHAKRIAMFAMDAITAASETLIDTSDPSLGMIRIRVGFHSGPVIASVIGSRSPKYGMFGDTVNTASRMESTSLPGRIQLSERTANILQKEYPEVNLTCRGDIPIKGKGTMKTFLIKKQTFGQ